MLILELLKSVLYGIVEGITEWLPVSSTGHLILLEELLPFGFSDDGELLARFWEMFEVVIQLGAILAVIVLFWSTVFPFSRKNTKEENRRVWLLWGKILVSGVPAESFGIVFDKLLEKITGKDIDGWLYNALVVAVALIVYGVAFIVIERLRAGKPTKTDSLDDLTFKQAFGIGLFQVLALVPGTSRSGSTILGSMLMGISRPVAAQFTFVMAIPVMAGASGIKALKFAKWVMESDISVPASAWLILAAGCLVSFVVSLFAIRFLMGFVRRHSFAPFGVYRVALGAVVLLFWLLRR